MVICGGVQEGKSSLAGRLLREADASNVDREQGNTVDGAYSHFSTARRRYLIVDTSGYEQITRDMVTGASTADIALILVDVRKGILAQTRRCCFLASLMGVRQILLAVNKMDLAGYAEEPFRLIEHEASALARLVKIERITAIPVSAATGENVVTASPRMPWHKGLTVLAAMEAADADARAAEGAFRFPVQWVNRPNPEFCGYAGRIVSGNIRAGDRVRVLPGGRITSVTRIVTHDGEPPQAEAGQSVALALADKIDISRGDMIAAVDSAPEVADQFEATIIWMAEEPLLGGRRYLMKLGAATVTAAPAAPKYRIDVNSLEHLAATTLKMNDIGVCNLSLDRPVAFDPYAQNRETGGFTLVDRLTNDTVGAGLLHFALRRSHNLHLQQLAINPVARARQKGQQPAIIWLTGLSGAGKSTIANLVDQGLYAQGRHTYILDGDNVRHGLNRNLGFTAADRVENVRRVAEVARLMADAGLIVIVSLISPYRQERRMARDLVVAGGFKFIEVFVDAPLAVAEMRDPKGLYAKARRGELTNFTGIDSPYEAPEAPELRLDAASGTAQASAELLLAYLLAEKRIR